MRAFAVIAVLLITVSTAGGHGRPPMTNGIQFRSDAPHTLYVSSTIGLLISHDDGCTFHWVCEENVGYGGTFDPKWAVADDGTIFATTFDGLRVSRDGGCSFTTATAALPVDDPNRIADLYIGALDIGPTGEVWVGTSQGGTTNEVYVSLDHGETFSSRGLASDSITWKSLVVAPSDATRVYVSGFGVGSTEAYRGDSTGWTQLPLAGVELAATPRVLVAEVDPLNRDIVYLVSQEANAATGGDRLYRSTDGGMTFEEVLATEGSIHDVFVRDAETVYATTMVQSGPIKIGGPAFGSTDGGRSFGPLVDAPQLTCIGVAPDGTLMGCGANWMPDFKAVAAFEDGAWTKVWRFVELADPLACPANPGHDMCVAVWPQVETDLGLTGPACGASAPDAGTSPSPPPESCCDVGGHPANAAWAIGLVWWLGRRRGSVPDRSRPRRR